MDQMGSYREEVYKGSMEKRKRIMEVIHQYKEEYSYPPTVREIGNLVGLKSSSSVQEHLYFLEREGYITRERTIPRSIRIIKDFKVEESIEELGI